MALTLRTLDHDELGPFQRMVDNAFLSDAREEFLERWRGLFEPERHHAVFDGDELIGGGGIQTRDLTLPGSGPQPVAAVTSVAVKPGHRRRGVLTRVMTAQLHGMHEGPQEAFAALWASEAGIYGRFGYGMASEFTRLSVPRGAAFRPGVSTGDVRVREVLADEAMLFMKEVYDRIRPGRTGWLSRSDANWLHQFADEERDRDGLTAYRYVLHPQGYAVYRVKHDWPERGPRNELHVRELVAETDEAFAALYRYLLDVDQVGELKFFTASDDPLVHLLADPRLALRMRSDSLWVRIVDVDRALPLRRYLSDVDTVLDVDDSFCPWNGGRWRLTVKGGEASVRRSDEAPDVAVDIQALGAAFLGGTRLSTLARGQLVRELTPGALNPLSHAFSGDREPHCPEVF
ncbi:putative acetyltransferase [Saccharothrix tamanrassetensis]|uniref:Putative acetyltransferase n=1 Tax=Saccharothrix tamanrassetensis TaxID=1051531 RepID=A0A841CNH7_9PSEU|nr:GNAT family N-acetyltransferase [Saccharothrix tamanrassetensis]MBB5957688.1 putative acetyltransferase [Saccharothrix tamanrassetensis]